MVGDLAVGSENDGGIELIVVVVKSRVCRSTGGDAFVKDDGG